MENDILQAFLNEEGDNKILDDFSEEEVRSFLEDSNYEPEMLEEKDELGSVPSDEESDYTILSPINQLKVALEAVKEGTTSDLIKKYPTSRKSIRKIRRTLSRRKKRKEQKKRFGI